MHFPFLMYDTILTYDMIFSLVSLFSHAGLVFGISNRGCVSSDFQIFFRTVGGNVMHQ